MSSILKVDTIQNTGGNNLITTDSNTTSLKNPNGTTGLTIDNAGRVLTGSQPRFFAHSPSGYNTASVLQNFTQVIVNNSDGFNSSTGIFTAPIAGTYLFIAAVLVSTGTGRLEFQIKKNNSTIIASGNGTGTTYDGPTITCMLELSVNDNMRVTRQSGTAYLDGGHSNSYFGGYLLG